MRAIRRAWLLLCWVRPHLAIRIPNGTEECNGGTELKKVREIERAERELEESFKKTVEEGAFAQVDPRRLRLNGQQWCQRQGQRQRLPAAALRGRVAVLVMGQPFRSRNYVATHQERYRATCTDGTVPVQRKLVRNHLDTLVAPIERELDMKVDVFLTDAPCSQTKKNKVFEYEVINTSSVDHLGLLKEWYGPHRVKGVSRPAVEDNMYERMARIFKIAEDYMTGHDGMYEYFLVTRYDIYFDKPFTSLLTPPPGVPAGHGKKLSFFAHAHDFFFAFPREMFVCMQGMFTDCLAATEWKHRDRRQAGCYQLGPLALPEWRSGFGYMLLMRAVQTVLHEAAPQLVCNEGWEDTGASTCHHKLDKMGTSAFDIQGHEHRCTGRWYWPPRHSIEDRLMPAYFHVGW